MIDRSAFDRSSALSAFVRSVTRTARIAGTVGPRCVECPHCLYDPPRKFDRVIQYILSGFSGTAFGLDLHALNGTHDLTWSPQTSPGTGSYACAWVKDYAASALSFQLLAAYNPVIRTWTLRIAIRNQNGQEKPLAGFVGDWWSECRPHDAGKYVDFYTDSEATQARIGTVAGIKQRRICQPSECDSVNCAIRVVVRGARGSGVIKSEGAIVGTWDASALNGDWVLPVSNWYARIVNDAHTGNPGDPHNSFYRYCISPMLAYAAYYRDTAPGALESPWRSAAPCLKAPTGEVTGVIRPDRLFNVGNPIRPNPRSTCRPVAEDTPGRLPIAGPGAMCVYAYDMNWDGEGIINTQVATLNMSFPCVFDDTRKDVEALFATNGLIPSVQFPFPGFNFFLRNEEVSDDCPKKFYPERGDRQCYNFESSDVSPEKFRHCMQEAYGVKTNMPGRYEGFGAGGGPGGGTFYAASYIGGIADPLGARIDFEYRDVYPNYESVDIEYVELSEV